MFLDFGQTLFSMPNIFSCNKCVWQPSSMFSKYKSNYIAKLKILPTQTRKLFLILSFKDSKCALLVNIPRDSLVPNVEYESKSS